MLISVTNMVIISQQHFLYNPAIFIPMNAKSIPAPTRQPPQTNILISQYIIPATTGLDIFRFEGFRNAIFFGKLLYQPRKQCFCLLMDFCTVGVAKSLPCAVRIKLFAALFVHALRVLMTVIRRPAFHLGFSSMRSIALTLPVFLALGFFHHFLLGFPYF